MTDTLTAVITAQDDGDYHAALSRETLDATYRGGYIFGPVALATETAWLERIGYTVILPENTELPEEPAHREVRLTADRPYVRHGSVVTFTGLDTDDNEVTFGVDAWVAQDLIHALYDDQEPIALVESWQILTVTPGPFTPEPPGPAPVASPAARLLDPSCLSSHLHGLAF